MPHLFEFMDQDWLPASLRTTLREILDCGNSEPFRGYYRWAARRLKTLIDGNHFSRVVELGAGTAPITRHLAELLDSDTPTELICCDINPDLPAYVSLVGKYGDRVRPIRGPVDFSQPRQWQPGTLLCLSATLHHIPKAARPKVLSTLLESADGVVVFEPLRKTLSSVLFTFGSIVPALLLPAMRLLKPGSPRRILWCWLIPIAPLLFVWDGIVSCIRQWNAAEWASVRRASPLLSGADICVTETLFCQAITMSAETPNRASAANAPTEEFAAAG